MLPSNASRAAQIRQINRMMSPCGPGLSQSGGVTSLIQQDLPTQLPIYVGKITTTGPNGAEADYTGAMYWVQVVNNYITHGTNDDEFGVLNLQNASSTTNATGQTVQRIVTASNPSEYTANSHSLATDTIVELLPVYIDQPSDTSAVPQVRWMIVSGGGTTGAPIGQYMGQFYGMVADNQTGFQDIFMIQGP